MKAMINFVKSFCSDKLIKCLDKETAEFVRIKLIDNPGLCGGEIATLADSFCEPEVRQTYSRFNKWNKGGANYQNNEGGQNHFEGGENSQGSESADDSKSPSKPVDKSVGKTFFKSGEKGGNGHQKQGKNGAKAEPTGLGGEIKCWNCNSVGHKRFNCPKLSNQNSNALWGGETRRVNRIQVRGSRIRH